MSKAFFGCGSPVFGNWPCPAQRPEWLLRKLEAREVDKPWIGAGELQEGVFNDWTGEVARPVDDLSRGCSLDPKTGKVRFRSAFYKGACISQTTPSPTWSPVYGSNPAESFYVDASYPKITDPRYYVPQIPYYQVLGSSHPEGL
jgi:hypothetical protein